MFEHEATRQGIQTSPEEPGKNFSEKLILKINQQTAKKHEKLSGRQRVKVMNIPNDIIPSWSASTCLKSSSTSTSVIEKALCNI